MEFTNAKKKLRKISIIDKGDIIHLLVSFMLGRVFLMDAISPFAMAYLSSYITRDRPTLKIVMTVITSLAGIMTTKYTHTVLRYMLAYVLFGLIYISVSTIWRNSRKYLPYISAFCAMSISGIIYYAQLDNIPQNMLLLFFECSICFVFPFITKNAVTLINSKNIFSELSMEDITGTCILAIVSMGGFCNLYIGDISVGKVLCGVFIMTVAYTGKCAVSATCGVGLGVLFSLYSFDYYEYAGILGFCGLVTGMVSGLKRPGIILAFMVSTRLLTTYFGGWSDSIFSGYETIVAICIFSLIPHSFLLRLKAYFSAGLTRNTEFKKYTDILNLKIKNTSKSFENLAELSRKALGKIPDNTADISTIYDCAANRICKSCGLKFICWGREAFDTRDVLNKTVVILSQKGNIAIDDIPIEFKQKCIKYESFANELNRIYFKYKANHLWHQKVEQSQKMLCMQLKGMSDIMDDFSENLNKSITFDKLDESKIMFGMEQADIKCSDVTVVKDHLDTASVTVVVKKRKEDFTHLSQNIEMVVSEAMDRIMRIESFNYAKHKCLLKLRESERFSVICDYVSIPKTGESQCGDNVMHSKISNSKYAMILSDGMGCGKEAAEQSITTIELMQQFLNAGFDKRTAVEMINSTLMLKNSETFATLDAVIVDMFTAKTEFVKAGANTSYIKTDNSVKKIHSGSLPIGIINSAKAETIEYQAKDGDIIILISDGIHNATDNWFEEYIVNMHEENPKIIAKLLADEAQRQKNQDDDMTVAVLKITKNREGIYV